MNEASLLIALIKYTITGQEPVEELMAELTGEQSAERIAQVFALAKKHDVVPMAANALFKLGVPQAAEDCQKLIFGAAMRYEQMNYVLESVSGLLESNRIPFIPLKGAVLRPFYPEPWLRTSCDIDILVRNEDVERAAWLLCENGYEYKGKGSHDMQFVAPGNVFIELHFVLIETDKRANAMLGKVWDHATPASVGAYRYIMDDAMLYFYHMAHMAKHFLFGGCGLRVFVDTWYLNTAVQHNEEKRTALLCKGGLEMFAAKAEALASFWLGDGEADPVVRAMEAFILEGGLFGSRNSKVLVQKTRAEGKATFLLNRLFMPYRLMRLKYPVLEKWPVLLPVFWVVRWWQLLLGRSKINNALGEMRINQQLDPQAVKKTKWLLQELELY